MLGETTFSEIFSRCQEQLDLTPKAQGHYPLFFQGTLTEGEVSVQLTSSLRQLVLYQNYVIYSSQKATDLNKLVQRGQLYRDFPFSKDSLVLLSALLSLA